MLGRNINCSLREDIGSRRKSSLVQDRNKPTLGFDQKRDFNEKRERESLAIDESSLKAPIQMDSTLVPFSKETIELQVQVQEEEESTKV